MIFATLRHLRSCCAGYIWIRYLFRPGEARLLNGLLTAVGMGDLAQPWPRRTGYRSHGACRHRILERRRLPLLLSFASVQSIPGPFCESRLHGWRKAAHDDAAHHGAAVASGCARRNLSNAAQLVACLSDIVFVLTAGGRREPPKQSAFSCTSGIDDPVQSGISGAAATIVLLIAVPRRLHSCHRAENEGSKVMPGRAPKWIVLVVCLCWLPLNRSHHWYGLADLVADETDSIARGL